MASLGASERFWANCKRFDYTRNWDRCKESSGATVRTERVARVGGWVRSPVLSMLQQSDNGGVHRVVLRPAERPTHPATKTNTHTHSRIEAHPVTGR